MTLNNHTARGGPLGFISVCSVLTLCSFAHHLLLFLPATLATITSSSSLQGATIFIDFRAVLLLAHCVFHYNSLKPTPFPGFRGAALVCSFFLRCPPCPTRTFVNEHSELSDQENSSKEVHLEHKEGQRNKSRRKRTRTRTANRRKNETFFMNKLVMLLC